MESRGMLAICVVLLLAAAAQAVTIPEPLPEIDFETEPANPSTSDEFRMTLAGRWPDSCPPGTFGLRVFSSESIWVDLMLPGAEDCEEPVCAEVVSFYQVNATVGPFAEGTYEVFVRAVASERQGAFEKIAEVRIGAGDGDDDNKRLADGFAPGDRVVLLEDGDDPAPSPGDGIVIVVGGNRVRLDADPSAGNAFEGCTNVTLETNFRARLSAEVTPEQGIGGTWEASLAPGIVGPGTVIVKLCIRVEDLKIGNLPPGKNTPVANVPIFSEPAL